MYKKECPDCGCDLIYKNEITLNRSIKSNSVCRSCRNKGEKNPFYGKSHNEETKQTISKKRIDNNYIYQTDDHRKIQSKNTKGEGNPMYGKNLYDKWLEKYGKEIADEKNLQMNLKKSIKNAGENNPMYGKPSPKGSGNGWSGWYNGQFFRSLTELSFILNIIERFGFTYESGEKHKYKISYIENGNKKTYFPDFVLNNKYIVECKPKKLQELKINELKKDSAIIFCNNNDYKYKIMDVLFSLDFKKVITLYENGNIIFTKKTEVRYLKYKQKYEKNK